METVSRLEEMALAENNIVSGNLSYSNYACGFTKQWFKRIRSQATSLR